jgi:hypothetical protein
MMRRTTLVALLLALQAVPVVTQTAPTVIVSSAVSGPAPATIVLTLTVEGAAPADVESVTCTQQDGAVIGTATTVPYTLTWTNVPAGTHSPICTATIRQTVTAISLPYTVLVAEPEILPNLPLVTAPMMRYVGGFRVPNVNLGPSNWGYLQGPLAYYPPNNSIYGVGHTWQQMVGEMSIPELRQATTAAGLLRAVQRQPFADPTGGKMKTINPTDPNSKYLGGVLPWGDRLIVSAYSYYDGNGTQVASHFLSTLSTAQMGTATGPFTFTQPPGFVSGYMATVPEAWRAALGGPAFVGQCCIPVVSRTSNGPGLFTFNPADVGTVSPIPVTPLVYYPASNPLEPWNTTNGLFNGTTKIAGVVMPKGTRSVLFIGSHGIGPYCYGTGAECKDPENSSKGNHAYPYVRRVWAYDALDLIAVKEGRKQPWEPRPYATWDLTLPIPSVITLLQGAAYDEANNRLYVAQPYGEGSLPVIHGYQFVLP